MTDRDIERFGFFTGQGNDLALMFGSELGWSAWTRRILQTLGDGVCFRSVAPAVDPLGNGVDANAQASGDGAESATTSGLENDFGAQNRAGGSRVAALEFAELSRVMFGQNQGFLS